MKLWKKLLLGTFLFLIIVGVATWYYLFKMNGLETIVNARLNAAVSRHYPFKVTIGNIGGSLLDELVLTDVAVRFDDSLGGRNLFTAHQISAAYSLKNLIDKNISFSYLTLDSAVVMLVQDTAGRFGLPATSRKPATDSAAEIPEFVVDRLTMSGCGIIVVRQTDTIHLYNVNLDASIKSSDQTVALDMVQASASSNKPQYAFSGLSGKLTYTDARVMVQDLAITRRDSRIKLSGFADFREKSGQFSVNADNFDLAEARPIIGAKLTGVVDAYGDLRFDSAAIHGTLALGGQFLMVDIHNLYVAFHYHIPEKQLVLDTAYGLLLGRCAMDCKGLINFGRKPETYRLSLAVKHLDVQKLSSNAPHSDVNALVTLQGSSFKSSDMLINVDGSIWDSYFADYPIQQAQGKMTVTAQSVSFPEIFTLSYFENQFELSGTVNYRTDLDLNVRAFLRNLDRYRGKLFMKELGGRAYAEVTVSGATKDPDLSGFLTSDSLWMYDVFTDSAEIGVQAEHIFGAQTGTIYATLLDGTIYGRPYDTLFTVVGLGGPTLDFDTLYLHTKIATATAKGRVFHKTTPQQVNIDTLTLSYLDQTLYNSGPMDLAIDDAGINIRKAALRNNGSEALMMGRYNYDKTLSLSLSVNDVPIKAWASLFKEDFPLDGRASLHGTVGGSLRNPTFMVNGTVDSVVWQGLTLGDLTLIASYRDRTLFLDSSLLLTNPGVYTATGKFNLDLDLTADSLELSDRPFDIAISATDRRFDLVSLFLPSVEHLAGDLSADVRVYGTPRDPHLEGAVMITGARLKYFDLVDTLYADSATFLMRDNQVIVDQIDAYEKDNRAPGGKSFARAKGSLTFITLNKMVWNIDVDIPRPFQVRYELDDIQARVEGDLSVEGESPPRVTGDLTVTSGRYRANFATPEEGSPLMTMLTGDQTWDLNVNLEVPSNFWIDNEDIDAEFSGLLNIIREQGNYRFIGEMEILRGKTSLFDRTWQIESGSRATYDDIAKPNPTLDITACTVIRGANTSTSTADATREDLDLCIHVTGTLETPQLATTGGGFTREDLIPLLVADRPTSDSAGGAPFTGMEQRLTGLLSTQVSQIGSRQLSRLGVETFEIDPLYSGKFDPLKSRVTLGFYTGASLYVYGRSSLSGATGRELGFEYRFNKSFLLEGRRDEEDLYHVNLKLHWEIR